MKRLSIPVVSRLFAIAFVTGALASCAPSEKIAAPTHAPTSGSHVSTVGKVTMHAGQPCTPQIMFDFRITGTRSAIQLAASMPETRSLTEAANRNRRVRIWGTWQHGQESGCDYIN